jgi:hypothetical protein
MAPSARAGGMVLTMTKNSAEKSSIAHKGTTFRLKIAWSKPCRADAGFVVQVAGYGET